MKLKSERADIFIPDSSSIDKALERTTDLCIAAHQDDTEIMAYSAIAECYARKDRWFSSVIVTDGVGSPRTGLYGNFSDEEMQENRRLEQRKAAFIGDYSFQIQLAYKSSDVKNPRYTELKEDLKEILLQSSPENVFLHNLADKHDTHVAVALRGIEAIRAMPDEKKPKKVYGVEVWRSLDWLCDEEKITLDASERKNLAAALLGVFDSQISGGKRYDLASMGRRLANATFYASHSIDCSDALIYAFDLTSLARNSNSSVEDFILSAIDRFRNDVQNRIRKLL